MSAMYIAVGVQKTRICTPFAIYSTKLKKEQIMVNWKKRVADFDENGFSPGEEVLAVASLQPVGSLTEATGRASFGLLGMFIGKKMTSGKKDANELSSSTMSDAFPDGVVIVAVTSRGRLLAYEQGAMSGKPKKLLHEYSKGDFTVESIDKGMLKSDMTIKFSDGGSRTFELAKGQNLDEFKNALA